jgi:hypothetical protein
MKVYWKITIVLILLSPFVAKAQESSDYYYQIPDSPEAYTEKTVAARMVDGLGFRFYWATEGLRPEDLSYKASAEGRTIEATVEHIMGLTQVLLNAVEGKPNEGGEQEATSYEQKRAKTLDNIKRASEILKSGQGELGDYDMIFVGARGTSEYPFWNLINGPIADAIWHCGQVVTLRRASGNPFNSNVSVLQGKVRD